MEGGKGKRKQNKNSTIQKSWISLSLDMPLWKTLGSLITSKMPAETSLCRWISNVTLDRTPPESNNRYNFISFSKTQTWLFSKDIYKRQREGS